MCNFLYWLLSGENWKDYLIPVLGSILGVIGAYWVMHIQFKRQKKETERDLSDNQSLFRSVYEVNLSMLVNRIQSVLTPLKEHAESIRKDKLNFSIKVSDIFISTIKTLEQIEYVKLYEAYRPIFTISKDKLFSDFVNSYDSYKRLVYLIELINKEFDSFSLYKDQLEEEIFRNNSDFMDLYKFNYSSDKPVYQKIKKVMDNYYLTLDFADNNESYSDYMNNLFLIPELHNQLDEKLLEIIKLIKRNKLLIHNLSNRMILLTSIIDNCCKEIPFLLENINQFLEKIKQQYAKMGEENITFI